MPAPASQTYSAAALVAAHTALRDLIDSHPTLPGLLRIRDVADVLLAEIPLADPCGTIDGATGRLTLDVDPPPIDSAINATGTAAYGEYCDGSGVPHLTLPCQAGDVPVSGKLVMRNTSLIIGGAVELISTTIG